VELSRQSPPIYPVLKKLMDLFALYQIQKMSDHFLEHKYFDAETLKTIRRTVLQLCREIRNDAVALVDSFNMPDWIIKSPLGRYDGNIYEAYFDMVVKHNPVGRPPYWESDIKPMTSKL
jgi:acyl-CoA oxidase